MTSPKKPRAATTAPTPAPAAALTADQLRIAQLFASMDDETQRAIMPMMAAMAERRPRRARPILQLVKGGDA